MNAKKIDTKKKDQRSEVPARPSVLYRGKLGENLTRPFPDFDLWDPNMHLTDWTYNSLHDSHLKSYFSKPNRKRLLIKHGLITRDEKVLCSRKEFSQHTKYVKTVQQSWEKLFVQKQKELLKEFMLQGLRGELPEHVTISDTKQWLVYKGKNTFKTMYQKFMKWSDPQCAELVWELSHRFQLEELEKKIIRELRLEGQGQEQLENLSRFLSRARPVLSISSNERNNTSAEDDMTVENLHNLIKKTTTSLTREVKENLASVMLEVLHEECSTPCSRTDSSSDFIPVSSKEDVDQIAEEPIVTAVSCQDSVSPVISGTASKEYRSSVLLNAVGLSGHSSGYSLGSGAKRALSKTKVDCSNQESSSAVKLISNPPSESSDSPSSAKLDNNNEIVLRVVDITVTKMMMETFRLHSSSPELATLIQDFVSVVSSHPQHEFILWLRSAVVETVMEQFFETEVTDVGDATGGESLADTVVAIGETATEMPKMEETPTVTDVGDATGGESLEDTVVAIGENATEMPKMEETPAGSRPKKVKRVRAFFRRAWQAVKRTFCCCH